MSKKLAIINVENTDIQWFSEEEKDYLCITDIAEKFNPGSSKVVLGNWLRRKDTIELLGAWESLHNPSFDVAAATRLREEAEVNRFAFQINDWMEATKAIGVRIKSNHQQLLYAHKDIALSFCYWLSPKFQVYMLKEFQRLKANEFEELAYQRQWSLRRELAKINYHFHKDAVKTLMPPKLDEIGEHYIYSNEADILNMALFGQTAQQWRTANSDKKGNMRDYATIEQLTVLANLENLNAEYIKAGLEQDERVSLLNQRASEQMRVLLDYNAAKQLKALE